jgi:hypothetical protein
MVGNRWRYLSIFAGVLRSKFPSTPSLVIRLLLITSPTLWSFQVTSQLIDWFLLMQDTKGVVHIGDSCPSIHDGPPDGGLLAWLQVAGSFCLYFCTWGTTSLFINILFDRNWLIRRYWKLWKLSDHLRTRWACDSYAIPDISHWIPADFYHGLFRLHRRPYLRLWLFPTFTRCWIGLYRCRHCASKHKHKVLAVSLDTRTDGRYWCRLSVHS